MKAIHTKFIENMENCIIDNQFLITGLMNVFGHDNKILAEHSGLTEERISDILSSDGDMTIRELYTILDVYNLKLGLMIENKWVD